MPRVDGRYPGQGDSKSSLNLLSTQRRRQRHLVNMRVIAQERIPAEHHDPLIRGEEGSVWVHFAVTQEPALNTEALPPVARRPAENPVEDVSGLAPSRSVGKEPP